MPCVIIDACCLIDLLASGHAEEILLACGHTWYLPVDVKDEVQFVRQSDPADARELIQVPVDLTPFCTAHVLTLCKLENQSESDLFTQYAIQFRSDGEAMCLALAQTRNWIIATDDRKAIRIAQQAGMTVISCPELVKTWADADHPERALLTKTLNDIELLAQFHPNAMMPEYQWWVDHLIAP